MEGTAVLMHALCAVLLVAVLSQAALGAMVGDCRFGEDDAGANEVEGRPPGVVIGEKAQGDAEMDLRMEVRRVESGKGDAAAGKIESSLDVIASEGAL